jgi:hypothetical protein
MCKLLVVVFLCLLANCVHSQNYICDNVGTFADTSSSDCRVYYSCIALQRRLQSIQSICPEGLRFHWDLKICVLQHFFDCPNNPDFPNMVPPMLPEEENLLPVMPKIFICPDRGYYPNAESMDCRHFFSCAGVGTTPVKITCSKRTIFNWRESRCVSDEFLGCAASAPAYQCPSIGNWSDPNSVDCSKYFVCFTNYDGTTKHMHATCPVGEAFDIRQLRCLPQNVAVCRR